LVTVDEDFWENASDRFLSRGHTETAYANGTCASLMRSGLEDCQDNYHTNTRELYLDELFFPENF